MWVQEKRVTISYMNKGLSLYLVFDKEKEKENLAMLMPLIPLSEHRDPQMGQNVK